MRTAIRKIGNSQGVLIPKPLLAEAGLGTDVEMVIEEGTIVLRPMKETRPRTGWAEAARELAAASDDALVWPELANAEDEPCNGKRQTRRYLARGAGPDRRW